VITLSQTLIFVCPAAQTSLELDLTAAAFDSSARSDTRPGRTRAAKLEHHVHRRTRPGKPGAAGIESLTERELQVARLVAHRKTSPQNAAELFLSQNTVETHLRTSSTRGS